MADPLSIAASVAGLVSLGAAMLNATFKLFTAVNDAPAHAKALLRSCNSLNVALSQVQRCLLSNEIALLDH